MFLDTKWENFIRRIQSAFLFAKTGKYMLILLSHLQVLFPGFTLISPEPALCNAELDFQSISKPQAQIL